MFVSLHFTPASRSEAEDHERIDELVEQAVLADRAGVSAVCLTEHHLAGFNTYCDPMLLGTHLAARLEQAYVGVHVLQAPLQHPVRMAEQCNMLDLLTRGRCMVAVASGSPRHIEHDAFGVPMESRSAMARQRLDAMLRAWGWDGEPVDVSTDFDQGTMAGRLSPSSFRKPHPLIGRATLTPASIVETAEMGLPVVLGEVDLPLVALYREAIESSGHDEEIVSECLDWLGCISAVSLARTEKEAQARILRFIEGGGAAPVVTSDRDGTPEWIAEWKHRQQLKKDSAISATPEMLVERLHALVEAGVRHPRILLTEIPGEPQANMEILHLFLEEVLPHLDAQRLRDPVRTVLTDRDALDAASPA